MTHHELRFPERCMGHNISKFAASRQVIPKFCRQKADGNRWHNRHEKSPIQLFGAGFFDKGLSKNKVPDSSGDSTAATS
jgi:hypothetical protein